MIAIMQGVPGSGKTLAVVEEIHDRLRAHQEVWTNIELVSYWPVLIASRGWRKWLLSSDDIRREVVKLLPLYRRISSLEELPTDARPESSRFCAVDEAQLLFNCRDAKDRGASWLRWFSQHRKFGFDVWLCAQDHSMLDKQLRDLSEQLITCFNLKRLTIPLFIFPPIPIGLLFQKFLGTLILRRWTMIGLNRLRLKSEVTPIAHSVARLYDTRQIYGLGTQQRTGDFLVDELQQTAVPVKGGITKEARLRRALTRSYPCALLGGCQGTGKHLWEERGPEIPREQAFAYHGARRPIRPPISKWTRKARGGAHPGKAA